MKQLKYIYMSGFLMASMSFAMESEGPITTFPKPIKRFAITPNGQWLATSENEKKHRESGIYHVSLLLKIWKKKASSEEYEMMREAPVSSPYTDLEWDIKLHWFTDQQRIAVLACVPQKGILWNVYDALNFNKAEVTVKDTQSELAAIDSYYGAHGEDLNSFTRVSDSHEPVEEKEDVIAYVEVKPTTIQWFRHNK